MARSMIDGATSSLTLAIGLATRTRARVLTAEDYIRIQGIGETNDAVKTVAKIDDRGFYIHLTNTLYPYLKPTASLEKHH